MSESGVPPNKKICVRSTALSVPTATSKSPERARKLPAGKKESPSEKENKTVQRPASAASSQPVHSVNELPWVDKYRPKTLTQLVGMHGDKTPLSKLTKWLREWAKHNLGEGAKIKKAKPPSYMTGIDGTPFKAILLSGSPGIGKTSTAKLTAESLGFEVIEMNASDVRSKKAIDSRVAELVGAHQIEEYFGAKATNSKKSNLTVHHVLIMDEVDGMSGNEDRAGLAELIRIIKLTRVPIICICNDRQDRKMRTLVSHCYDVRFPKPKIEQIRSRMMTICTQEKLKITPKELDEIIELSDCDVRQTIYNLQLRAATDGKATGGQKKDVAMDLFQAARRLLTPGLSLAEMQEMFFVDYGIMPLFVHENYLNIINEKQSKQQTLACIRRAADLISLGDICETHIRSGGAWKLLNEQSMLSAALPCQAMKGLKNKGMLQFPVWLGKNSTGNKRARLLREVTAHSHLKVSGNAPALAMDYMPVWRHRLTNPLLTKETEGIKEVVETMVEYDLIKDDIEAINELTVWPFPGKIDPACKILPKVKAALTRALNKEHRMLPYAVDDISKGRKVKAELKMDEEGNWIESDEDEGDSSSDEDEAKEKKKGNSEVIVKSRVGVVAGAGRGARGGGRGSRGGMRGGGAGSRGASNNSKPRGGGKK